MKHYWENKAQLTCFNIIYVNNIILRLCEAQAVPWWTLSLPSSPFSSCFVRPRKWPHRHSPLLARVMLGFAARVMLGFARRGHWEDTRSLQRKRRSVEALWGSVFSATPSAPPGAGVESPLEYSSPVIPTTLRVEAASCMAESMAASLAFRHCLPLFQCSHLVQLSDLFVSHFLCWKYWRFSSSGWSVW